MVIREILVKSILSKSKVSDWTINPYVGCQHSCVYCYAKFMKRFTDHKENWGEFVDVKINAAELLVQEVTKKKKGKVWISGVCDPYQPIEDKYKLTRQCLEILQIHKWHVTIQTKSSLVLRDLALLKKFDKIEVGLTITTGDENIRKIFEPRTVPIKDRIKALEILHKEGIKTFAMIAPLLPGSEALVYQLKGKVDNVIIDKLNYHYADWVFKKYKLKMNEDTNELGKLFISENIPCQVI
ncbi:MAG: radical SAM protein [bacterium]